MTEIPPSSVERLIRKASAGRVSAEAAISLTRILEDLAASISIKAIRLAKHAGRKTVTADDIKLAK
ncbi:MAG: NFYB/HAP3 family transcription factor subunit [Candidatus Burarchaeum sp.]|nr:histone [Candidatus Burarchaeum sp.]MDO8340264.1 NFYB/HAP3 family transcription factor subunit [Candidatus Burarchaeum sp.]